MLEGSRFLIGGADAASGDPRTRARMLDRNVAQLRARLARWLEVSPPPAAAAWAGTFAETTDGVPLIGRHPSQAGVWLPLAHGGNGITFGAVAADLQAGAVLDQAPILPIVSPDRAS